MKPTLIIVTGLPCTGKTTLAEHIASHFSLPLVTKDQIKERMFERLGWSDREWSRKLGLLTYDLMYYFTESHLAGRTSGIVESNFNPEWDTASFRALQKRHPFDPYQVMCVSHPDVLIGRFQERMTAGKRHPGHVDSSYLDEFKATVARGPGRPLDIGGKVVRVDTTDFEKIDYDGLYQGIAGVLQVNNQG